MLAITITFIFDLDAKLMCYLSECSQILSMGNIAEDMEV